MLDSPIYGYFDIVGDGNFLYAQYSGRSGAGILEPYIVSAEDDGTSWTALSSQTFAEGPYRMDFDPVNRIVYSSNWDEGVWALKVQ